MAEMETVADKVDDDEDETGKGKGKDEDEDEEPNEKPVSGKKRGVDLKAVMKAKNGTAPRKLRDGVIGKCPIPAQSRWCTVLWATKKARACLLARR